MSLVFLPQGDNESLYSSLEDEECRCLSQQVSGYGIRLLVQAGFITNGYRRKSLVFITFVDTKLLCSQTSTCARGLEQAVQSPT